jgi:hypothetical protein
MRSMATLVRLRANFTDPTKENLMPDFKIKLSDGADIAAVARRLEQEGATVQGEFPRIGALMVNFDGDAGRLSSVEGVEIVEPARNDYRPAV